MQSRLCWGILATGRIAGTFARALGEVGRAHLLAAAGRTREAVDAFALEHGIPRAYDSFEALLDDRDVDAVYIATPHPFHAKWAIRAAAAGKHVFCEKPAAMNERQLRAMLDAARASGVTFMEAFVYRCHPVTERVIDLVRSGVIGPVRFIEGCYGFNPRFDPQSRLFDKSLGGGALLDVGVYPVSYARLLAGVANGEEHAEPLEVHAVAHLGSSDVDEWSAAVLRFPGDILATLRTTFQAPLENGLRLTGATGRLSIVHPFHPNPSNQLTRISVWRSSSTPVEELTVPCEQSLFAPAIERFTDSALAGAAEVAWPGMRWDDSLGNVRTLDRWRECIGLRYDADTIP